MSTENECPVSGGDHGHTTVLARVNRDWWPNQAAKAKARGYRSIRNLKAMVYLRAVQRLILAPGKGESGTQHIP